MAEPNISDNIIQDIIVQNAEKTANMPKTIDQVIMSSHILFTISLLVAIALWYWLYRTLKKAIKIKAIKGLPDAIIIALLFFITGGLGSIIYLKIKIKHKQKPKTHIYKKKSKPKKEQSKLVQFLNKFWAIVWKDDSFKGWIISLVFLFVVIKGIFFPIMSAITGTTLPLVIVESCSMYHEDNLLSNYDEWFDRQDMKYFQYKINKKMFDEFPFKKGFNKGDILFITGVKPEKIEVGDVIIFAANYRNPIIHRVIDVRKVNDEYYFSTLGDNNNGQIEFEKKIGEHQIVGKAQANIAPFLGWGKLIFFEHTRYPIDRGFCEEN